MPKNAKKAPLNSTSSKRQVTTSRSRQRRRSENAAIAHLRKSTRIAERERRNAEARIRDTKRPMVKAKRIVEQFQRRAAGVDLDGRPDLSDVQELRVKLIRRDGLVDTQGLLHRLEVMVAKGCTKADFENQAGIIWELAGVVWKTRRGRIRKAEREAENRLRREIRGLADPE